MYAIVRRGPGVAARGHVVCYEARAGVRAHDACV